MDENDTARPFVDQCLVEDPGAWIRELLPAKPWLVCLEICDGLWPSRAGGAGCHHPVEAPKVKWIKSFCRDCLNDLEHEQTKRDWKNLVNADEVSRHD
jgi:hypothetical protein